MHRFIFVFLFSALIFCGESLRAMELVSPDEDVFNPDTGEVLSPEDAALYAEIFKLQEAGSMKAAEALYPDLSNKILMGYVLAQKYLSPKLKSSPKQIQEWLKEYADEPRASEIYSLARKRNIRSLGSKPKTAASLRVDSCSSYQSVDPMDLIYYFSFSYLKPAERKKADRMKNQIRGALRRGKTLVAKNFLEQKDAKRLFSAYDYDRLRTALAFAYFVDVVDKSALALVLPAAERSGESIPLAYWVAGLTYWRQGDYAKAAGFFEKTVRAGNAKESLQSSAAFWTARALLKQGNYENVNDWLSLASTLSPRSFYGILAARALGQEISIRFQAAYDENETESTDPSLLLYYPEGKRAIALNQAGQTEEAEEELTALYAKSPLTLRTPLIAILNRQNMGDLAKKLVSMTGTIEMSDEDLMEGARPVSYPTPAWQPATGQKVDRALIFAIIRQESCFNNKAFSSAGARGIMQLMPGTAKLMARGAGLKWNKSALHEPIYNLTLGQEYINTLLNNPYIQGNLFMAVASYNAGTRNVGKWTKRKDFQGDPLLFIEGIPSRETRMFVERVMANYWMYRSLLGQKLDSIDEVLESRWPIYYPQEIPEGSGFELNLPALEN